MKIALSWLREWVDIPWDAAELSRRLTASGFEVEGVEPAAPAFSGVVVAEITSIAPHPEADKLRVIEVVSTRDGLRMQLQLQDAMTLAPSGNGYRAEVAQLAATSSSGVATTSTSADLRELASGAVAEPFWTGIRGARARVPRTG